MTSTEQIVWAHRVERMSDVGRAANVGLDPVNGTSLLGSQYRSLRRDAEADAKDVPALLEQRALEPLRCEPGAARDQRSRSHRFRW
jgi:hypothetical protein